MKRKQAERLDSFFVCVFFVCFFVVFFFSKRDDKDGSQVLLTDDALSTGNPLCLNQNWSGEGY